MSGKLEPVIYRNETPAPTKQGWYWAAWLNGADPMPVHVADFSGQLKVFMAAGKYGGNEIGDYRWFGPVTMVRES